MKRNLDDYLYKYVNIVTRNGQNITGYVDMFCSASDNMDDDNPVNEDSIGIIPTRNSHSGIELYDSEIESITLKITGNFNGKR